MVDQGVQFPAVKAKKKFPFVVEAWKSWAHKPKPRWDGGLVDKDADAEEVTFVLQQRAWGQPAIDSNV